MAIKPRKMFTESSRYIKYCAHTKTYELRVPSPVVSWPQAFRECLVTHYVNNKDTISLADFDVYKQTMESRDWVLHKQRVGFRVIFFTQRTGSSNRRHPVTFLHSSINDKALLIDSANPAMRSLMVYSFLTGEAIGGLPKLKFIEKHVLMDVATTQKKR